VGEQSEKAAAGEVLMEEAFMYSKNVQTLHAARFEYFEQLSQLGRLQVLNRIHVINSGTQFNLNFP
jgi:hypothetical protein